MTGAAGPDARDPRALINAYLLERLAADDRAAVEDRFFADDSFAGVVLEREDDLLDKLAAGVLADDDARALRARVSATEEGRQRLHFAQVLRAHQHEHPIATGSTTFTTAVERRDVPWARFLGLALAAGMAWLAVDNSRLRSRLRDLDLPASAPAPTAVEAPPATSAALRLVLSASRTRGADQVPVLVVPPGGAVVHLVLPGVDGADRFEVRVESSPGGDPVAEFRTLRRSADGAIDLWLATAPLASGDYEVLVRASGSADAPLLAQYAFRVQDGAAAPPSR